LEGVRLVDQLPGQLAPLAAQLVAQPRELLLLRQVLPPRREPLVVRHYCVGCHRITPFRACSMIHHVRGRAALRPPRPPPSSDWSARSLGAWPRVPSRAGHAVTASSGRSPRGAWSARGRARRRRPAGSSSPWPSLPSLPPVYPLRLGRSPKLIARV